MKGDVIMADQGFSPDPYLEAQGVKMNVPAFKKGVSCSKFTLIVVFLSLGKSLLSEKEATTRRIASVRIHVEKAMNRLKTFWTFQGVLPTKYRKTNDSMMFVRAGLCNLKRPLIANKYEAKGGCSKVIVYCIGFF